jgi:hypothetical protein
MRLLILKGLLALAAAESVSGSSWFGRTGMKSIKHDHGSLTSAAYNKWHETELDRWLSDNNIPHPTPADRRDLENLVKENWDSYVVSPYNKWDTAQLKKYIAQRGEALQKGASDTQEELVKKVKASWTDTDDTVSEAYTNVRDWIFDRYVHPHPPSSADKNPAGPSPNSKPSPTTTASLFRSRVTETPSSRPSVRTTSP